MCVHGLQMIVCVGVVALHDVTFRLLQAPRKCWCLLARSVALTSWPPTCVPPSSPPPAFTGNCTSLVSLTLCVLAPLCLSAFPFVCSDFCYTCWTREPGRSYVTLQHISLKLCCCLRPLESAFGLIACDRWIICKNDLLYLEYLVRIVWNKRCLW